MKKFIAAAMAIGCSVTAAFGGSSMAEANGKSWFLYTSGSTATIYAASDGPVGPDVDLSLWANWKPLSGDVTIPSRLVCEDGAFTVTGITSLIGTEYTLESLRIPATVTTIAEGAFSQCFALQNVKFDGNVCDTIDISSVFAGTPFLEQQINFWTHNNRNTTIANACEIEFFKDGRRGEVRDANLYKPQGVEDKYYTVAPRWYKVKARNNGYLTLNTWYYTKDQCDLKIDVTQGYDLDVEDAPVEEPSRWTATGEKPNGYVRAQVEAGKTYFIKVYGYKNKGRRARGEYLLMMRFGTKECIISLNPNGGTLPHSDPRSLFVFTTPLGTAIGELPSPTREGYSFTGWYYDKKCTRKYSPNAQSAQCVLYAGWKVTSYSLSAVNDPSRGAKVAAKAPNASNKTVTYQDASGFYGKAVPYGGAVTLTATAKDGYVFDRWQFSDNDGETTSGFLDDAAGAALLNKSVKLLHNKSLAFNMPARNLIAAAQYISTVQDYARTWGEQPTEWYLEDGVRECEFKFACRTYPSLSYSATKGLIGDMTLTWDYDGTNVTVRLVASEKAMKKSGIWTITVTATSQSGLKASHTLKVIGKNDTTATTSTQSGPARLEGLYTGCRNTPYTNLVVGVKCNAEDWVQYGIHADTANGWSIADVSGVPGVSFDPKLNNGYGGLTGAPTKAGTFVATVTVEKVTKKKVGKKIKVTTESKDATCLVVVQPLPEWLVGTYSGWTSELLPDYVGSSTADGFVSGSRIVTATIGSTGKFSAKVGGIAFAANNLTQGVTWAGEPKRRIVYGYDVDIVKQSRGTGKDKKKVVAQDDLHLEFACDWTNFYDRASTGSCIRWRKANNSTQTSGVSLYRNEFGKTLTAMDPTVYDMLVQLYYDDNGEIRVSDLTGEYAEVDELYAWSEAEGPDYVVSTGYVDGRKALYNMLWTDGVGTAYFCGNVHWEGKMIDLTGSATMCITRIGEDETGLPYLREVRTPEEWRTVPGYIVFAKFVKDGYAFEVAWHFSGLTNPILDDIRGVLLP